jgi:hypothetical protein
MSRLSSSDRTERSGGEPSLRSAYIRSVATLAGGTLLVVLLAPQSTWVALVLVLALFIGVVVHGANLRRLVVDVATTVRSGPARLLDLMDDLEFLVAAVLGTVVFVGINLFIWRWVLNQGAPGLIVLYLVVLGSVILSVLRDLARFRLGPVTAFLGLSWLCCVLWVGFNLE